jgi:hypothetical protein
MSGAKLDGAKLTLAALQLACRDAAVRRMHFGEIDHSKNDVIDLTDDGRMCVRAQIGNTQWPGIVAGLFALQDPMAIALTERASTTQLDRQQCPAPAAAAQRQPKRRSLNVQRRSRL